MRQNKNPDGKFLNEGIYMIITSAANKVLISLTEPIPVRKGTYTSNRVPVSYKNKMIMFS